MSVNGVERHLRAEIISRSAVSLAVPGSGKSSLLSLLLRYFEPSSGRILLDGVDIRSLDPRWLKAQIGIVTQVG